MQQQQQQHVQHVQHMRRIVVDVVLFFVVRGKKK
jgi:hypothetical protein